MFSHAIFKALEVYGIAIVISMLVAALIKIMVVAALSGTLAALTGPNRILRLAESKQSWACAARAVQHSHQPRH